MQITTRLTLPTALRMQEEAASETWAEFFDAVLASVEVNEVVAFVTGMIELHLDD